MSHSTKVPASRDAIHLPFNEQGNLPPGVYQATLEQAIARFGATTAQRQELGQELHHIYNLVAQTGHLKRFVLYGSFVTAKPEPSDIDLFLVMAKAFTTTGLSNKLAKIFSHRMPPDQISYLFARLRESNFDVSQVLSEAAFWFAKKPQDKLEQASIFWMKQQVSLKEENQIIATWQITKSPSVYRGIVEIIGANT